MNIQQLKIEIEKIRNELANKYEKCIENGWIDPEVIDLSQKLDQLILEYSDELNKLNK